MHMYVHLFSCRYFRVIGTYNSMGSDFHLVRFACYNSFLFGKLSDDGLISEYQWRTVRWKEREGEEDEDQ